MNEATIRDVLRFWFEELEEAQWFKVDPALDRTIAERFLALHEAVARATPEGATEIPSLALATVIVLDQFPRNMFRGTPRAFATDPQALAVASAAVDLGIDVLLTPQERIFLYLPFEHAEDAAAQARAVVLFEKLGEGNFLDYAKRHKTIIDRFGRFPHRNAILGRASTGEEIAFLAEPGSSF
jgi:uncharacterized protein (DUF924 family)